jgi:2-amino-4-hydroxy-6-hydroxymethyldihydropteridine diphosphokinase
MATVYLGLGSNLGDREKNIRQAIELLQDSGLAIEKVATMIETDPMGGPVQGKYLNTVIKAQTVLPVRRLLNQTKEIETALGRTPTVVNGPRLIDIDILLYDREHINSPTLIVPHPRMREREIVTRPLLEIEPNILKYFTS